MTDNLQKIDGVGPSREENLIEAGYEEYRDLAEADPSDLTEEISRLPEDSALEVVVQAQNLADLEEAEVTEGEDVSEEESEEDLEEELNDLEEVEDEPAEEVEESEASEETEFDVEISFDDVQEYDTFYHTLIGERCNLRRTNRAGLDSYEKMLDEMRNTSPDETFQATLTKDELNDLHNAVLEQRIDYQGENLIDYMDALRVVENKVNGEREAHLF